MDTFQVIVIVWLLFLTIKGIAEFIMFHEKIHSLRKSSMKNLMDIRNVSDALERLRNGR